MDEEFPYVRIVYLGLAALAGAVTALAFMKWKEMTWPEVSLTVFVGASFSIFVTPWVANWAFGYDEMSARAVAGLTYTMAAGAHILLPVLIKRFRKIIEGGAEGSAP